MSLSQQAAFEASELTVAELRAVTGLPLPIDSRLTSSQSAAAMQALALYLDTSLPAMQRDAAI